MSKILNEANILISMTYHLWFSTCGYFICQRSLGAAKGYVVSDFYIKKAPGTLPQVIESFGIKLLRHIN